MNEFFRKLFDVSDFPARWHCGNWSDFHGWLYILSDLAIFCAYAAIPLSIAYFVMVKRQDVTFTKLYWFFAAFILSCGLTHLIDAVIFWHPVYRLSALIRLVTALASWSTVLLLFQALPVALALPGANRLNAALQIEIEERKRSEAALRESSTRLALAVKHSRLGDWSWDPHTDKVIFSARASEIFDLSPDSATTWREVSLLLHPEDQVKTRQAVLESIIDHSNYDAEYRVLNSKTRSEKWVSATGKAEYGPDGKVVSMFGTVQDITQRKQIENDREHLFLSEQAARSEAERVSQMKDEFLATISHELRTPLNAIVGWAHLLSENAIDSAQKEGLAVIERNSRIQAGLVDDLLDMSRIITGKIRFEVQPVDLRVLVAGALESVRPSATAKQITLLSSLDTFVAFVIADPSRLQQIIWNLLTNALKFTPANGQVEVDLSRKDDLLELAIRDNGEGISPEFLPFIFDRFRQADASTTRRHGGLGLGLSIVKNLTELHGGTISAESAGEGRGACFLVVLPAAKSDPKHETASAGSALAEDGSPVLPADDSSS